VCKEDEEDSEMLVYNDPFPYHLIYRSLPKCLQHAENKLILRKVVTINTQSYLNCLQDQTMILRLNEDN